jgi:hypothetical protein
MAVKTAGSIYSGAEIYKNKKATEIVMSDAALLHAEKMARGEIEYKAKH